MYLQKMLTPYPFQYTINTSESNRLIQFLYERIFHMSRKYDIVVFIGRFQPPHIGHMQVCESALAQSDRLLILTGSANRPATPSNPWSAYERKTMLTAALRDFNLDVDRVIIRPLNDQTYNDQKWVESVQSTTAAELDRLGLIDNPRVGIIGHDKDDTSYYLKMFPQWELISHDMNEVVHATDIRKMLFEQYNTKYLTGIVPPSVADMLVQFKTTPTYTNLVDHYTQVKQIRAKWDGSPYEPMFITVDAAVIQSGHILLVTRKANPGRGLLALPGGYLNPKEYIVDGMIRELREETRLKVPSPVLKGSIKSTRVFDAPNRSDRGRIVTHAFLIELPPGELPKVKGSDDAAHASWYPLSELKAENFFEDHWDVIKNLCGSI